MKVIAFVVLCSLAAAVKGGLTKEEAIEAFRAVSAGCVSETGASEADVEVVIQHLPAKNQETKCLRACIMKKFNLMNGDGKFDKAVGLKMAEIHTKGDAAKMKIAEEIGDACSDIAVPDDHCEAAESYKMCMSEEAKKHGVNAMFE